MIVAGFIRLEMAEKLMKMGVDITIIQRGKRLLHALDEDMTSFAESKLLYQWVGFMRGVRVTWVAERQLGSGVVWRESPDFTAI